MGPPSESLGDLKETCSLGLSVPKSIMRRLDQSPLKSPFCWGEGSFLGLLGTQEGTLGEVGGRDIQLLPSWALGNRGLFQGLGVLEPA